MELAFLASNDGIQSSVRAIRATCHHRAAVHSLEKHHGGYISADEANFVTFKLLFGPGLKDLRSPTILAQSLNPTQAPIRSVLLP
jgi:hypothetical protein